jgi:hypothetical protein
LVLWRSELKALRTSIEVSLNKAVVGEVFLPPGRVLAGCHGGRLWRGPEAADSSREVWVVAMWSFCAAALVCCRDLGLMRQPLHISAGSVFSAAWMPSTSMAGRRLLPPWSSVADDSDLKFFCRRMLFFYLQAFVPCWRPSSSGAVCSRRGAPSGLVPGGAAIGRRRMRRVIGGEGAGRRSGLDCFSHFCSRVFSANVKGHVVIFFIF